MSFEAMWRDLAPLGRSSRTGGYRRLPWTSVDYELDAWFAQEASRRGLRLQRDGFGNQVAWWGEGDGPALLTGSHLDSVADGGGYDGPLGVVSALAAIDLLRERGVRPVRRLGVAVFAAEEGSRFGLACLGSRLAAGAVSWDRARELRDADGIPLADLVPGDGSDLLAAVDAFVELHIEQGRALGQRVVGQASAIWPHGRWRFDVLGEANHAGSTAMEDRRDSMLTYAAIVMRAAELARELGVRATFGRVEVHPNSTNAIAERLSAWLDARAATAVELDAFLQALQSDARSLADRGRTFVEISAESVSGEVTFAQLPGLVPVASQAGHDAGVLAGAGIPSSMLFVRNPTGVSHAPGESATLADCLGGVAELVSVLEARLT